MNQSMSLPFLSIILWKAWLNSSNMCASWVVVSDRDTSPTKLCLNQKDIFLALMEETKLHGLASSTIWLRSQIGLNFHNWKQTKIKVLRKLKNAWKENTFQTEALRSEKLFKSLQAWRIFRTIGYEFAWPGLSSLLLLKKRWAILWLWTWHNTRRKKESILL